MGTIVKYVFYALVIVAIYYIGVGFYAGRINKDSSLSEVGAHVAENTKEMMQSGYQKTKDAIQGGIETLSDDAKTEAEKAADEIKAEGQNVVDEIK